jgi:hypothetical protein
MPGCNIYNEEHQQLLVKFTGHISAKDLEEEAAALASVKQISKAKRKYISFFAAEAFNEDITMEAVEKICSTFKLGLQAQPGSKTAFVTQDNEGFAIARMFKECLKKEEGLSEVKIFTNKDEAFSWLGGSKGQWVKMRERVARMCSL